MGATRPFRQAVKCGENKNSKQRAGVRPRRDGALTALDGSGLGGLVALQMPDHVGDVGDLLLEVALVLLQAAKPIFAAREATVPAEAWASAKVSVSVHVHLLSS